MARLVEEEENYWPGFVDALSTIVMVVTFLLIILGVVIFAISTQVSKALSEGTMISKEAIAKQTSALTAQLDESQQQVAALTAQQQQAAAQAADATEALAASATAQAAAEADAQRVAATQVEAETKATELAEALAETKAAQTQAQSEAATLAAQLQAKSAAEQAATAQASATAAQLQTTTQTLTEQAAQLAASTAAQQAAETQAQTVAAQLQTTTATLAEQAQQLAAEQQANQSLSEQAAVTKAALAAAQAEAEAKASQLADTAKQLEEQTQTIAKLTETVATQNATSAALPTQDVAVTADNTMQITSRPDIDATEIVVQAEEDATEKKPVLVTAAREVLTVRFQSGSVDMSAEGSSQALQFVADNKAILSQRTISLWSFYDGNTLALTQAKRSAYFRLLAVRNALLEGAVAGADIDISVRVAEAPGDADTVKVFLQ